MKIDKAVLAQAVGLMLMSWAALPIVYYLLKQRKNGGVKKKNEKICKNTGTVQRTGRTDEKTCGDTRTRNA